ncbi:MAG: helix-turn-helix transcriptional regulator [Desulfovibrio sp.]|nr:helix-turn-helix transcriptional regulator [Desulfovibrio sp.]
MILRYCDHMLHFDHEMIEKLTGLDAETVQKIYYGFRNKVPANTFDKLCALLNLDYMMLLSYAKDWQRNRGGISKDMPFPVRLMLSDGNMSSERFWFQHGWFEETFQSVENISIFKLPDNSLSTYGFNRDDVVLASRLPEHVVFMIHHIYMIRERDGCIYPRVAEVYSPGVTKSDYLRLLCNPLDKSDRIAFAPLPEHFSMIGRLVWKSGFM